MSVERYTLAKDYTISRVINGCWQLSEGHSLGKLLDYQDIMRAFTQLVESGFTTFDCADIYSGAEDFLGEFVNKLKTHSAVSPQDIQIHTKYVPDINMLKELTFEDTEKIIDRSLKKLNRETLDLVQFHWWDYNIDGCVETAMNLDTLKRKGKIRHIAVTNFDQEHLSEIVDAGVKIVSCQSQYSVLDRRIEKGFHQYCMEHDITQICYGTLAGGLISDKMLGIENAVQADNRSQVKYLQVIEASMGWGKFQKLLQLLSDMGKKYNASVSNISSKYILSKQGVGAVIIGTRSSRHVKSNQKLFAFNLEQSDIDQIDQMLQSNPILKGQPFELERTEGSIFRSIMKMNLNHN